MVTSDPIADMLTRIRNAHGAGHDTVEMPHSCMKGEIARVLKREGYIRDYVTEGGARKTLRLYLKYDAQRRPAVRGIRRVSAPGHRRYVGVDKLPRVLNGMGIAVLSTSGGLMTDREARKRKTGGEVICTVW